MAGQGGLDADAMWAELKKADSSKIIDASHIPTSVLDGRWVTLSTNQTITGQKTFTQNILFSNNITGIRNTAGNLVFGAGNENIFCILNDYVGPVEAKNNQLVLGNDVGYWKKVTAGQYISKVATGVSPLIVSSNTLVNNLNSNYLEGYNNLGFIHSNYSASTGGTAYVSGDTHIMLVAEINIDTTYSTYVILLSNEFWGHQHYSALQLHIACTNNDNSGNKSPRCSVHVMSLVGSHARGVRYKIENNKAYIFIEVYGGNSYGRWASTILQNYDSITTNNANTTGNIKLKFAFNQANSGLTAASYDNYINAASLAASRTLWGQPFNGTANVSGNMTGVGSINMSGQLTSTVASGVAPFIVVSNTVVGNLNADLLDGQHGAYYQNRMYDGLVSQYRTYAYIEFLRFVIPSGQNQLSAYVIFDLCRVETGGDMSGRAVLRIRRGTDNNAGYTFYVTNFGRSWLPELRCTTDDGITWRVWMKCVKDSYDPYVAIKIVEQYPYGYVTKQKTGTTGTPSGSKYTVVAGIAGLSNAANILVNTRNIFGQPFNGSGDVGGQMTSTSIFVQTGDATLKVYSGRITDARSDGNICLQTSIDATDGQFHSYPTQYQSRCNLSLQPRGGQVYIGQNPYDGDTGYKLTVNGSIKSNGNIIATGAITAKASSSDIRLKTDIQGYDAMGIIRKFRSVKYHWNAIAKENSEVFNHDNWNYGLIAQDLLSGGYTQWVKDIFNDYYTIDYERLIPVVWKGLQEVDDEVTRLKKRVRELEKRLGINNK